MTSRNGSEREIVATAKGWLLHDMIVMRGRVHISEAAKRLGCTERHIYKIIRKIQAESPIEIEDGGWITRPLYGCEI